MSPHLRSDSTAAPVRGPSLQPQLHPGRWLYDVTQHGVRALEPIDPFPQSDDAVKEKPEKEMLALRGDIALFTELKFKPGKRGCQAHLARARDCAVAGAVHGLPGSWHLG